MKGPNHSTLKSFQTRVVPAVHQPPIKGPEKETLEEFKELQSSFEEEARRL